MENHWVAVPCQEFPDILGHWTLCFINVQIKNTKRPCVGQFLDELHLEGTAVWLCEQSYIMTLGKKLVVYQALCINESNQCLHYCLDWPHFLYG